MPKFPINYSTTHFYRIICKDLNIKDYYLGFTTEFKRRKHQHKLACTDKTDSNYDLIVYKAIRENGGWENWDMILIDTLNLKSKLDALSKEIHYTREFGSEHELKRLGGCDLGYNNKTLRKLKRTLQNE